MSGPLGHRTFRFLLAGRGVSMLGMAIAPVAIAFAVLDLTGSPAALGIVLAARSIPQVALMLIGGVISDRFDRSRVLQQHVPSDRLARVYSFDAVGSYAMIPIGQLAAGPLAVLAGVPAGVFAQRDGSRLQSPPACSCHRCAGWSVPTSRPPRVDTG